jgi:hypothetical protein
MYKLGFCIYGPHCRYKHTKQPGAAAVAGCAPSQRTAHSAAVLALVSTAEHPHPSPPSHTHTHARAHTHTHTHTHIHTHTHTHTPTGPPPDPDGVEAAKPREARDYRKLDDGDGGGGGWGGGYGGRGQHFGGGGPQRHGKRQRCVWHASWAVSGGCVCVWGGGQHVAVCLTLARRAASSCTHPPHASHVWRCG